MKILFIAHRTPYPPDKGEKIRAYHILSHLARRHVVSVVYWVDDPKDAEHRFFLRKLCRGKVMPVRMNKLTAKMRAISSLTAGRSFSEGYYYARKFRRVVDRLLNAHSYDAIYVFSSPMASYVEGRHDLPRLVDFVDLDSNKWGQLAQFAKFPLSTLYRIEQERLSRYEVAISNWARCSLFISPAEADLFTSMGGKGSVAVVPNGADLDVRRLPLDQVPFCGAGGSAVEQPEGEKLIFVGTMNYYPNADAVLYFAREIFPLIRRRYPRAIFEIVGRFPPRSVRRLDGVDGVRVVGKVGDVRSFLIQADVSVAPMRIAQGVQNKVLEAMGMGVPVVATPQALKGLDIRQGQEILIGDTPEQFAMQVMRLLSDAQLRNFITKGAWNKVKQAYNWEAIGAKFDGLVTGLQRGAATGMPIKDVPVWHT